MYRFPITVSLIFALLVTLLQINASQASIPQLWGSDLLAAETELEARLKIDEKDAEALRGLILTHLALGRDEDLPDEIKRYAKKAPHGVHDRFLLQIIAEMTSTESRDFQKTLYNFARKIAEHETEGTIEWRIAQNLQINFGYQMGKLDEVADLAEKRNLIKDWSILGPFENTSGSGIHKEFVKSFHLSPKKHIGKQGISISWFAPSYWRPYASVYPSDFFHLQENTTAYARTRVYLSEADTYWLSVGHYGDIEIYINDELLGTGDRESQGAEVLQWHVDLPAGWVWIGVKISGREDPGAFEIGLSRLDGSAIPDLEIDPFGNESVPVRDLSPRPLVNEAVAGIEEKVASMPDDPEAAFWNLYRLAGHGNSDDLETASVDALERFPESALVRLAVAEMFGQLGMTRRLLIEESLEITPTLNMVRLLAAQDHMDKKRYARATQEADKVLADAPGCFAAHVVKYNSLEEDQLWEEMEKAAGSAADQFPGEPGPRLALARCANERGLLSEEKKQRKKAIELLMPGQRLFQEYLEAIQDENFGKAKDRIEELIEYSPTNSAVRSMHIRLLLANDEILEALDLCHAYVESFPQDVELLAQVTIFIEGGWISTKLKYRSILSPEGANEIWNIKRNPGIDGRQRYEAALNKEAARMLERAVDCDPGNFALRDRVNRLRGEESFRTLLDDPEVSDILEKRVDPADYPGQDAVVLLSQKRRLAYQDGACLVDHLLAVQIFNNQGAARWQNIPVERTSYDAPVVLLRQAIKEDGTETDGRLIFDKVLFSNLTADDIIVLHYQTTEYTSGSLHRAFWDQHVFGFPNDPCVVARYELWHPPKMRVYTKTWNAEADSLGEWPHLEKTDIGLTKATWEFRDLPPTRREAFAADIRRISPWVDITTVPNWHTISDWYRDISAGQAKVSPEIRTKAEELTADCTTEQEKAARIFYFVSSEINYESIPFFQSAYIPRLARDVLRDRFGDCKDKVCLMIAMMKSLGYDNYNFALVTPGAPSDRPFLPSPRFNHVIVVQGETTGKPHWYDPTMTMAEADQVPLHLRDTPALVVKPGAVKLITVNAYAPPSATPYAVDTRVTMDDAGDLRASRSERFEQVDHMSSIRNAMGSLQDEELRDFQSRRLGDDYPGVEVDSVSIVGLEPGEGPITLTSKFEVREYGFVDQEMVSMAMPWTSHLAREFGMVVSDRERETALDLRAMNLCEMEKLDIELPGGKQASSLPKAVDSNWGECHYRTIYEKSSKGMLAQRELIIVGETVAPDEYPAFREWLNGVLRDLRRTHHLRM